MERWSGLGITGRRNQVAKTVILCVIAVYLAAGSLMAGEGWRTDFRAAEAQAKADEVPLVIHFHASWCGPCRRMESEVLGTAQVSELLGNGIIGVKVDSDRNGDLVSRFGVTSLPTDVIISADGTVLSKDAGSPGLSGYVSRLRKHARPAVPSEKPASAVTAVQEQTAPETPAKPDEKLQSATPAATASVAPVTAPDTIAAELRDATKLIQRRSEARIGMGGFSPVAYAEKQSWAEGSAEFSCTYQGVDYLLSSAAERDQFKAAPEKYAPALHGCDSVLLTRSGEVQVGLIGLRAVHESRIYFFASTENRNEFLRDPAKFTAPRSLVF